MVGRDDNLYSYKPAEVVSIVFAILFAFSTAVHVFQAIRSKCWKITGALPWAGVFFVAGLIVHEVSVRKAKNLGTFVAAQVLLLGAAPVYSLANHMTLGRTLYYVPYLSIIHPGRVISTFVGLDVIVEILNSVGARKAANLHRNLEQIEIGNRLVRASLLLQIILFIIFMSVGLIFHQRLLKGQVMTQKLRTILTILYISSVFILIRNIYRCIEAWQGYTGYLRKHEAFFYVFDAGLMLVNTTMLNAWHPARYLPSNNKVYLAKDGMTEVEGPGWVDSRGWLMSTLDPFDLAGLIRGKDKETAFWDHDGMHAERGHLSKVESV